MKLVLVESPTKAKKLSSYLGKDYVVRASVGHIRDLPKSKLGVDVEHGFEPQYLIPKDKTKVVKELKDLAKKASQIILATDPDREGEAIGWHLLEVLEGSKNEQVFVRATFHEITKQAILDAIDHPSKLNMALVDAQQARRILDRLVGYSVSPVLWKKIRFGLSAGRVQSVALRLIVEREREIKAFKPEEYWEVDVLLSVDLQHATGHHFKEGKIEKLADGMLVARVVEVGHTAYDPKSAADVTPITEHLNKAKYHVASIEKKERRRASLPPFTTSTLQQQAATRFGYTSKNTMRLAQQLYEEGLITYHRTDSLNLSGQSLNMAREYIHREFGPSYVPEKPRFFANKSKNAQEAHEAIRPTEVTVSGHELRAKYPQLSDQHAKLYDLIWRRFVGSQMETAVYDSTTVMIQATLGASAKVEHVMLKSTGSILKFDGWMKLFPNQGDMILPDLKTDQDLKYIDESAMQKFTQPPPRYNDASLVKTLESEGIGRPSTYASIISVIEDRGYVERQDKKFVPTAIGMVVNDFLVKHFTEIVDYHFTANMEDDLDAIARGEKKWQQTLKTFYDPFEKEVTKVLDKAERAQIPVEKTGEKCPKCGETERGEIVIRTGRYGKFKSCSRFPDCDFTENIVQKLEGAVCPLCQKGEVILKPTRYGKEFYGCSLYPACDWASWSKPEPGLKITPAEWKKMQAEREERRKAREAKYGKSGGFSKGAKVSAKSKPAKAPKKSVAKKTLAKKSAAKK